MILYLHGFRSSPDSFKARLMAQTLAERGLASERDWQCPQLPASPKAAMALAMSLAHRQLATATSPRALTVIGSSLGGYYATWLAEQLDCKAVLLNPAVHAPRDLATQVGQHRMYHSDAPFEFRAEYVDELAAAQVAAITRPERYFLIAATGDEVLDWREMRDCYTGCRQRIVPGSDHGLSDFAQWLPEVLDFAQTDSNSIN
ncbi:YqiA/YcfP family alpha/beta fold hydrolase [Bordetella tumulicola]|uniref:YqiA/YcfP family alpha/beta fold hydrolase n=1 Tax=Bordetella tumulicola TaxID=1649133 RepID=UPI0039EEB498